MGDFDKAVQFVLSDKIEGGYVNNPADPGGETNFGISKRAHPNVDIKNLTREGAIAIYKREYWDPIGGDDLPAPLDLVLFDSAVNEGPGTAKNHLQAALESQDLTDISGADPLWLATDIIFQRLDRYTGLKNWPAFGKGWTRRMLMLYDEIRAA
jgi:lysozyme family protein